MTPVESTSKIYNANENSAKTLAYRNLGRPNFREALIEALHEKSVLGPDGKVERRLEEGLDATDDKDNVDYTNRLKYIQEINKIVGLYAPQKIEKKSAHFNFDISEEELDEKIRALNEELEDR